MAKTSARSKRGRPVSSTPPPPRTCKEYKLCPDKTTKVYVRTYQWDQKAKKNKNISYKLIGYLPEGYTDPEADMIPILNPRRGRKKKETTPDTPIDNNNPLLELKDERRQDRVVYPAYLVLVVMMMCAGSGMATTRQIAEFWQAHHDELAHFFHDCPDRFISHDTIRNFVLTLGKCDINFLLEEFNAMLLLEEGILDEVLELPDPEAKKDFCRSVLALDGQAVRASKLEAGKETPHCCLSVYNTRNGFVQGQELVGKKTNEIPHARTLLGKLDIRGAIITADAMHTQVELLRAILKSEADYCMAVKGNQSKTLQNIRLAFDSPGNERFIKTETRHDKGHGRLETRTIRVLPSSVLEPEVLEKWPGLETGCIAEVVCIRLQEAADKKSTEKRYFITSLNHDSAWIATWLLFIVRRHWHIENKLHWVLDVTYRQDFTNCANSDYLRGITALNKLMYNFTATAQRVLAKERGTYVSMQSMKPIFTSVSSFLKLVSKVWVGVRKHEVALEEEKAGTIASG